MNKIYIYTDGSCLNNPGKGAYGIILKYKEHEKEITGGYELTTNNRMELMSVIVALENVKKFNIPIEVYSDSRYIVNAINLRWVFKWKSNSWKKSDNKKAKNIDL